MVTSGKHLLLLACFTVGCADAEPETGSFTPFSWCTSADFERPDVEVIDVDVAPASGLACDCTDAACMIGWIEDNLGCGVCVHLSCASGPRSGCLPCPQPTPSADRSDSADSTACVLAPVATNPPGWDVQVATSRVAH